ncbi:DMT family transporter [Rhizorhabdus wittichii]|uniref:DMT family transporter n=1 Tax=Rhizorhabdus wittichii TaxID=160791 RepID=UPI0003807007|nr:DMT family transporter [Rhizorhabdus wittichii]
MDGTTWGLLGALSAMWGAAFFFTAIQLEALPPFTIVLLRVGLSAGILLGWTAATRIQLPACAAWPAFFGLALLNNVIPFVLYAFAQQTIPSSLAGVLNATAPLWGVLVAHIFTRDDRATPAKVVGVGLGMAGVIAMAGHDAWLGLGSDLLAQIACLGAALCYALAAVRSRKFIRQSMTPLAVATAQLCAATMIMLPVALWVDRPWMLPFPAPRIWAATSGAVLISTVLAYVIYFKLIARVGASTALLVTFTVPIVAILLGVAILGEMLLWQHLIGMALIASGLAAMDGRAWRLLAPRRPG